MKKTITTLLMALTLCLSFSISSFAEETSATSVQADSAAAVSASAEAGTFPVYRLYNKKTKEHLWTRSKKEYDVNAASYGWTKEGIAWQSASSGTPVYRLYNKKSGDHHYTKDTHEISVLVKKHGWKREDVMFYSNGKTPVYRQYNKKFTRGAHHFTADKNEYIVNTTRNGWVAEGIAFYVSGKTQQAAKECVGTLELLSAPKHVNGYEDMTAVLNVPSNGTLSILTSNDKAATCSGSGSTGSSAKKINAYVRGGIGEKVTWVNETGYTCVKTVHHFEDAKITITFTPDKGYSYSGPRSVSFTVNNTVYPCNDDGSYTVTYNPDYEYYWSAAVSIGGFSASSYVLDEFPDGSVIRTNMDCVGKTSEVTGEDSETGFTATWQEPAIHSYGYYPNTIVSSSNENVAWMNPCYIADKSGVYPMVIANRKLLFIGPGETDLTYEDGKTHHYIVTGSSNQTMKMFRSFINSWSDKVSSLSDVNKVKYTVQYICINYTYEGIYDAYCMYQTGAGDCWAGNSLLYTLCKKMGFPVRYRNAANDKGAGSGHRNCVVTIDGTDYIADATPETSAQSERVFMKYDDYMKKYGNE